MITQHHKSRHFMVPWKLHVVVFLALSMHQMGITTALPQQENTVIPDSVNANLPSLNPQNFNPTVTASCRPSAGLMTVHLNTQAPFFGRIMSRSSGSSSLSPCSADGTGHLETSLTLNMLAAVNDTDYCGVIYSKSKNTYSIAISVRLHKTLELAEDKQYIVTCNRAQTSSPIKSPIRLVVKGVESGREVSNTYYGRSYSLAVEVVDGKAFRVKECVAFGAGGGGTASQSSSTANIVLFDENGCPESRIVSRWRYDDDTTASTTIYSMFRFENSKRLTIQCVVYICDESDCSDLGGPISSGLSSPDSSCPTVPAPLIASPAARFQFQRDTNETSSGGGGSGGPVLTSLTVNVLDVSDASSTPGEDGAGKDLLVFEPEQCVGSICPRWLLWLVITLGILFLLMLLVNLFLCSALTCTCTRTELIEKEPSIVVEDYDPYRNSSWAGSQYGGSRYSLNPPQNLSQSGYGGGGGGGGGMGNGAKYH